MEGEKKSSAVSDAGAWAMNVISSVGIIMANKQLMSAGGYAFGFATTLTGFHFAVTALVGLVSNAVGYSASKDVPLWELLWFSIVANISITGMNFSLMLNSVGFYQISKLSMIPVVCVMEWILHNKHYSREVKMSVVVVVIGVGVCTVTDVKVNAKGSTCACLAVLSTSLQQISIGSLQKKYSIGSFELLSKTAPIQALSLLFLGPVVDYFLNGKSIADYKMSYVLHHSIMHAGGLLQREPVPLHRPLLCSFLPGSGSHENSMRSHIRVVALRLRAYSQEHNGHDHSNCRHGDL
ncbi:UDP-rhamnose/UDP-galactose transporter 2-like isoform X2 [Rhodamnia argentea]|uniref:UDP-rhamnose/UDP-galactose transporter 2-like isoform X2 n=1 Tax=Rhodamnia argentea TaxID=178133 RepID=A0ABM3GZJ2_9MYRT|nr:UDP-rhamnose/UDP-galactose transporter 2-like isoform X2 [Rhodamnia argentea]